MYYRVNIPNIASETVNQETVIINFNTGLYYHTNNTGSVIWQLLEIGNSINRIVENMILRYPDDSAGMSDEVSSFISILERESLIVTVQDVSIAASCEISGEKVDYGQFSPPVLNIYTDMAELLLLDPVHEVEDRGSHNIETRIQ